MEPSQVLQQRQEEARKPENGTNGKIKPGYFRSSN